MKLLPYALLVLLLIPHVYATIEIVIHGATDTFLESLWFIFFSPAVILVLLAVGFGLFSRRAVLFVHLVTWTFLAWLKWPIIYAKSNEGYLLLLYFSFFSILTFCLNFVLSQDPQLRSVQQKIISLGPIKNFGIPLLFYLFSAVVLFYAAEWDVLWTSFPVGFAFVAFIFGLFVIFVWLLCKGAREEVARQETDWVLFILLLALFVVTWYVAPETVYKSTEGRSPIARQDCIGQLFFMSEGGEIELKSGEAKSFHIAVCNTAPKDVCYRIAVRCLKPFTPGNRCSTSGTNNILVGGVEPDGVTRPTKENNWFPKLLSEMEIVGSEMFVSPVTLKVAGGVKADTYLMEFDVYKELKDTNCEEANAWPAKEQPYASKRLHLILYE